MTERRLRMGVAGLGRAFTLMLPTLVADPRVELVAAADPRSEATQRFAADFGARAYDTVEALCAGPDVEVVYVATAHRKHRVGEKPVGVHLGEGREEIPGRRARRRVPDRRPQPQLRSPDPA